jgi:predicted O-linked N-acetylglucosamine transferase (SPINDLY family)
LAVQLASDALQLKRIKDKVQQNKLGSALFDPLAGTHCIEAAYTKMYERYRADLPTEHIFVD